jgi:hypothetical protein
VARAGQHECTVLENVSRWLPLGYCRRSLLHLLTLKVGRHGPIGAVQNASHWRGCYGPRYNEDKQQILLSSAVFLVLAGRYRSKLARHSKYSDIDMRECSFPYNPSRWPDQLFRQIFKSQMRPDFGAFERLRDRQIRFLPCARVTTMPSTSQVLPSKH